MKEAAKAALFDRGSGLLCDDLLDTTWLQEDEPQQAKGHS